jgi:hypothetical protein
MERLPGVIITAALMVLAGTLAMAMSPRFRALVRPPAVAYETGDPFSEAVFGTASATRRLIVVSGPNCGASDRSHAFLADAVSAAGAAGMTVWLYTTEAGSPAIGDYAARLGIGRDRIVPVDLTATRIGLMPTLVLLDRDPTVLQYWETPADEDAHARILQTLRTNRRP